MKKLILSLFAAFVAFAPQTAAAFSFDWGVTGGYNLSKVKFSDNGYKETFSSGNRSGWFLGPKIHLGIAAGFCIDAAATYSQRNIEIEGETDMFHSFEIPVNLKYSFGLGKQLAVFVSTGPQFGFALGQSKWDLGNTFDNCRQTFKRDNMQTTWNIGAGLRLFKHLDLGVGYNFALSKMGKTIIEDQFNTSVYTADGRLNTFQLQATYYF